MKLRTVIHGTLATVMILIIAGVAALFWFSSRSDAFLHEAVLAKAAELAPGFGIEIDRVHFDHHGRIRMQGVTITPPDLAQPMLRMPEVLLSFDRDWLTRHKRLHVLRVVLNEPVYELSRTPDGGWNWDALRRLPKSDKALPEWRINDGTVIVRPMLGEQRSVAEMRVRHVDVGFVPSARRQYTVRGEARMDDAGPLTLRGEWNLINNTWSVRGKAHELQAGDALIDLAASFSPKLQQQIASLKAPPRSFGPDGVDPLLRQGPSERSAPFSVVSQSSQRGDATYQSASVADVPAPHPQGALAGADDTNLLIPELGIAAKIDIDFNLRRDANDDLPQFEILADVRQGQLTNPAFPVPLYDMQGSVFVSNNQLVVRNFRAGNGKSRLAVDGSLISAPDGLFKELSFEAANIELDSTIRGLLPEGVRRLYDMIQPAGRVTVKARLSKEGNAPWKSHLDKLTIIRGTARHVDLPYPIQDITGSVTQVANEDSPDQMRLKFDMVGYAGLQPMKVHGYIDNPGLEAKLVSNFEIDELPIDENLLAALQTEKCRVAYDAMRKLQMTGLSNVRASFIRPPGPNQKTLMRLHISVHDGTVRYDEFPYPLSNFSGEMLVDPLDENEQLRTVWRFSQLRGTNGAATVTGDATFETRIKPGLLTMHVDAQNIALDEQAKWATTRANPLMKDVWHQLSPSGRLELRQAKIEWTPGTAPLMELPFMQLTNGNVTLRSVPLTWRKVTADFQWADQRVVLKEFRGRHDQTTLHIDGREHDGLAYFEWGATPGIDWLAHAERITIENLNPDPELRRALPVELRTVLNDIDLRGSVDLSLGAELKVHHDANGAVTANWDGVCHFDGNRMSVGVDLTDVTGQLAMNAIWTGDRIVTNRAEINLEKATTWDTHLTNIRAPFSIDGNEVVVGSPKVLTRQPTGSPPVTVTPAEQLMADVHGGKLMLNARAEFGETDDEQVSYAMRVDLVNADLGQWARQHQYTGTRLAGKVNARLNLFGRGTSERNLRGEACYVKVSPAALYDLPAVVKMLSVLKLQPADAAAFQYADAYFSIHDGLVDFNRIELVGNTVGLTGRGQVWFAEGSGEKIDLDFYSRVTTAGIPVLREMTDFFSRGWIHLKVEGSVGSPVVQQEARIPVLDDAFQGFMRTMEGGQFPRMRRP